MRDSERVEWEVADESLLPPMEWGFGICMFGCEGEWECVHSKRAEWEVANKSLLPLMGFLPPMVWGFGVCMLRCEGEWECVLVSESEKWEWEVKVTNKPESCVFLVPSNPSHTQVLWAWVPHYTILEPKKLEYEVPFLNPKCHVSHATVELENRVLKFGELEY